MKKLLFVLTASLLTGTVLAKLPPATNKDKNTIRTQKRTIEYSRRGSLGTMDYVVTDITNVIHKGINSWTDDEDEEGEEIAPIDGIYGFGVTYKPGSNQATIVDPVSGKTVPTAYYFRMEGHDFISSVKPDGCPDQFSYFGQGQRVLMMNLPMCYGTNMVKGVEARIIILPYFGAADTDLRAPFNANYHYMADRTWVLQMLQAQANGTLNISGSGDTITASITRGGTKGGGDTRSLPIVTDNNTENTEEPKAEESKEEEPKTEGETVNENTEEPKTDTDSGEKPAEESKTEGENTGNESTNETPAEGNETQPVDNGGDTSIR